MLPGLCLLGLRGQLLLHEPPLCLPGPALSCLLQCLTLRSSFLSSSSPGGGLGPGLRFPGQEASPKQSLGRLEGSPGRGLLRMAGREEQAWPCSVVRGRCEVEKLKG